MPAPHDAQPGPLAGVRVVDLSRVISGPYVGRLLADLGADVIKLEPPDGDQSRQIAPRHDRGMSANFTFANVGKRGLAVDLRQREGIELVIDLVRAAQLVIENFRPKVIDLLGLGWEVLHAANPSAVLLSLNGFGHDSELANQRAYAPIMHAITGILEEQAAYADRPAIQNSDAHADTVTSLHATVALLAALRVAEASGVGQHVEVPMFDAVLTTNSQVGRQLLPQPDDRVMNPIYDAGAHGRIATAGPVQHIWRLLAARHDDLQDPTPPGAELATKARLRHTALEAWMASRKDQASLLELLADAGIACAPLTSMHEALTGAIAQERQLLSLVDDRRGGTRPVVRAAARFSNASNQVRGPAPLLGEHNASVLSEWLGYDAARLRALEANGVLSSDPLGSPND